MNLPNDPRNLAYYVALAMMLVAGLATIGVVLYEAILGAPIPGVVMTLFGVVLGFLTSHISSAQGASQALTSPPAPDIPIPLPVEPVKPSPDPLAGSGV